METWRMILGADLITARRHLWHRFKTHPFVSIMFFFTTLVTLTMAIQILYFLNRMDWTDSGLQLDRPLTAVLFFSVVLARGMMNTYRKLFEARELLVPFSMPIRPREIVKAKFLGNLVYSVVLYGTLFLMTLAMMGALGHWVWIPPGILLEGILLLVLANAMGFVFPLILQIRNRTRKNRSLALAGTLLLISMVLVQGAYRGLLYYPTLGLLAVSFVVWMPLLDGDIIPGWLWQQSKPFRVLWLDRRVDRRGGLITGSGRWSGERFVSRKDYLVLLRQRDMMAVLFSSVMIMAVQVGLYMFMGPHSGFENVEPEYSKYVYPLFLALSIYLAGVLQFALLGLSSVGMEGRSLWILKTQPVEAVTVVRGKARLILAVGLPVMLLVALPLPLLDGMPLPVTLFFLLSSVSLSLAFTGIGIWSGARLPNFDETMKYLPDLMAQFTIVFLCLFIALVLLGIPAAVMRLDTWAGVVAAAVGIGWGYTALLWGIRWGAVAFERIQSDEYL